MRILIKTLTILVLVVLLAVGALAAYLTMVFNPNDYRSEIESRARDAAGIELKINGEIGWSLYPWLALDLNDLSVSYPDRPLLAQLSRASASLNIPALLGGEVQVDSVLVSGLNLSLHKTKDGGDNWTAPVSDSKPELKTAEQTSAQGSSGAMKLAINQIKLAGAQVSYQDDTSGQHVQLNDLSLQADRVDPSKPFPFKFSSQVLVTQGEDKLIDLGINLDTELSLNLEQLAAQLNGLSISGTLKPAGLPAEQKFDLKTDLAFNQTTQLLSLKNLTLSIGKLNASGELNVSKFDTPEIAGQLKVAQFNPTELAQSFGVTLPKLGDGALSSASLSSAISGGLDKLNLSELTIALDQTKISGTASYGLNSGAIAASLKGDSLNLDTYMPPATESKDSGEAATGTASKGWSKDPMFDLTPLRSLTADLALSFDKLIYQGNEIQNLTLKAKAAGGKLNVSQLTAQAMGGQINATASVDARKDTPLLSISPDLKGIQIKQLLAAASMEKPPVEAKVNLGGALTTQGTSMHSLINGLNGQMKLSAAEGVIQGIDMAQELCQNIENLTALGINPDQVDRTTPIADLSSTFNITNGVVNNPDFGASIDAAKIDAKGTVNLPVQTLDYNLGLTLTDDLFNQSCGINPALKNTRIPVNCKGGFDADPAKLCKLDTSFIGEVIKKAAGQRVQEELDKKRAELEAQARQKVEESLQNQVGDQIKGEAGNLLKGLFGN